MWINETKNSSLQKDFASINNNQKKYSIFAAKINKSLITNYSIMKKIRNLFFIAICAMSVFFPNMVWAQKEWGVFNSVGVGVGVGLTGIDVELATPITPYLALRGGISIMPDFNMSTDVDVELDGKTEGSMNVNGSAKRMSGQLLLNVYPFRSASFFLTAGAYFGGSSLVTIDGTSDQELKDKIEMAESSGIVIGDQVIPFDENGNISGGLKVKDFRPYVGLGFGRVIPSRRINMNFELGVQFHGKPEVYTDAGEIDLSAFGEDGDTFSKIVDKLTVYPVLKIRLNGRIF